MTYISTQPSNKMLFIFGEDILINLIGGNDVIKGFIIEHNYIKGEFLYRY